MLVAIVGSMLGGLADYFNPKTRFLDWLAALFYMPAALSWVEVLSLAKLAKQITNVYLRWGLWVVCLFCTAMLFNSIVTWKFFVFRKIVTPISDEVTGLGTAAHRGFNGRLIACISIAAVLSLFPPTQGKAQGAVDWLHGTVRAFGTWSAQGIGVDWLGFPEQKAETKKAAGHG